MASLSCLVCSLGFVEFNRRWVLRLEHLWSYWQVAIQCQVLAVRNGFQPTVAGSWKCVLERRKERKPTKRKTDRTRRSAPTTA